MSKDFERTVPAAEPATPDATSQARRTDSHKAAPAAKDPMVGILWVLIAGVIIAILAFVVSALVMGYIGTSRGAQNRTQADLSRSEAEWKQQKDQPYYWSRYIDTLASAKQYSKAQDLINQMSKEFAKTDTYDYYAEASQANLYFAKKDYEGAIKQAEKAQDLMNTAYQKLLKKDIMPNKAKAYGISSNYGEMELLRAGCYTELGKTDEAINILKAYLTSSPNEAGVWFDLGNAYVKAGNKDEARKAFDKALKFMPDDPEFQKARKQLGDN